MPQITVYTTDPCSFCGRVKQLLTKRGLAYTEVNLSKDPEGRAQLVELTGMLSFPQVVIGDEVIGGFLETVEADRSGRLRDLLAAERRP
jgi:glutaredoxin 3